MDKNLYTKKYHLGYRIDLRDKARKLRSEMTAAEKKLWYEYLREHKYRFLRQKPIGDFIVDFYCPKLKLAIEVDGETHLDEKENLLEYDKKRTEILGKSGIKVIRFWNDDVLDGIDVVGEIIDKEMRSLGK